MLKYHNGYKNSINRSMDDDIYNEFEDKIDFVGFDENDNEFEENNNDDENMNYSFPYYKVKNDEKLLIKSDSLIMNKKNLKIKNRKYLNRIIKEHYFNYKIDIFLSNVDDFEEIKTEFIDSNSHDITKIQENDTTKYILNDEKNFFYIVKNFQVNLLISPLFFSLFTNNENKTMSVFTHGGKLYQDNVITVIPNNGMMILTVDKDTYFELGIPGKKINITSVDDFYEIRVDLKNNNFKFGNSLYSKTETALSKFPPCSLIFQYSDSNGNSINIDEVFDEIKASSPSLIYKKILNNIQSTLYTNMRTPVNLDDVKYNDNNNYISEELEYQMKEFYKWIGLLLNQNDGFLLPSPASSDKIFSNDDPSKLLSTFSINLQNEVSQSCLLSFKGFYNSSKIYDLFLKLKSFILDHKADYGLIYIHGFNNSPITWKFTKNNVLFDSGANNYCFVLFSNEDDSDEEEENNNNQNVFIDYWSYINKLIIN